MHRYSFVKSGSVLEAELSIGQRRGWKTIIAGGLIASQAELVDPSLSAPTGEKQPRSCEFETCPGWAPGMDKRRRWLRITLNALLVDRFDHTASWTAKVRNVSRLGSHNT